QVNPDDYVASFPHLRSSLAKLIRAHRFLENNPQLLDPSAPACWPQVGQRFLGFQLVRELGRGAFARVYLATQPALGNRQVAVKVSLGGGLEAQPLGRLGGHANIVPVYSVEEEPGSGVTAVCMPYLGSATLVDLLDRLNSMPALPQSADTILAAAADRFPAEGRQAPVPRLPGTYVQADCPSGPQPPGARACL